jgi:hypothetical protein
VILQGNVGIFVSVLLLTKKKYSVSVEFMGIDTHAYALLLIEWQLRCSFVRSKMVDPSLFLQLLHYTYFTQHIAAFFSPLQNLLCACVSEICKIVLICIYYMFLLEGSAVVYGRSWKYVILFRHHYCNSSG